MRGSERPDEIITLGGHLDSWDIEGAHDDGSGVVHTLKRFGPSKPWATHRGAQCALCFSSTKKTETAAARSMPKWPQKNISQVCGMWPPCGIRRGGFVPRGVRMDALDSGVEMVRSWASTLEPYNLHYFGRGGSGVDIGPLKELEPRPLLMGLVPDGQRYFDLHHSSQDVGKTSTNGNSNLAQPPARVCF